MKRIWDDVVTPEERALYERAGYGRLAGIGARPAVLLVDLYLTELPPDGAPADRAAFRDPLPPGAEASLAAVRALLAAARARDLPVFYTTNLYRADGGDLGGWRHKSRSAPDHARRLAGRPYPLLPSVAPQAGDHVIPKQRPSAFFGTPLVTSLIDRGVDTLLVGGQTTSGCVRASVVDAFSYGYRTVVVEECSYDRCATSHKVNLFDMHQKYADVMPLAEVLARLEVPTPAEIPAAR
jgi:nicotinamidase-related amidase